jgi:hypothetical protein
MAAKVRVSTKFKEAVKSVLLMRVYCLNFLFQTIDNLIQIPIGGPTS